MVTRLTTAKASLIRTDRPRQRPAGAFHQFVDGADRGHREQPGVSAKRRVTVDHRQRLEAALVGLGAAHQHQCRGAVGDRAGVGRRHRAAFAERRLQLGILSSLALGGCSSLLIAPAFAHGHGQRHDLVLEAAILDRLLGAGQRGDGEGVLGFAAEAVLAQSSAKVPIRRPLS
jgi:hypothetical protein